MKGKRTEFLRNNLYQPLTIDMGEGNPPVLLDMRQKKEWTPLMTEQTKIKSSHLSRLLDRGSVKTVQAFAPQDTTEPAKVEVKKKSTADTGDSKPKVEGKE